MSVASCVTAPNSIWQHALGYIALVERLQCRQVSRVWVTHVRSTFRWEHTLDVGQLHLDHVPARVISAIASVAHAVHTLSWVQLSSPLGQDDTRMICGALHLRHCNAIQAFALTPAHQVQLDLVGRIVHLASLRIEPWPPQTVDLLLGTMLLPTLIGNGLETLRISGSDHLLEHAGTFGSCRLRHLAIMDVPRRYRCTAILVFLHCCPELASLQLHRHSAWEVLRAHPPTWQHYSATLPIASRMTPKLERLGLSMPDDYDAALLLRELKPTSLSYLAINRGPLTKLDRFPHLKTLVLCDWNRSSLFCQVVQSNLSTFDPRYPLAVAYDVTCVYILRVCRYLTDFTLWFAEPDAASFRSAHLPLTLHTGPDSTLLLNHIAVATQICVDAHFVTRTRASKPHGDTATIYSRVPVAVAFTRS